MKAVGNAVIVLTGVACLAALAISVYPGALDGLYFFGFVAAFLAVPVVGLLVAICVIVLARRGKLRGLRVPWAQGAVVLALLGGTYVSLKFYVPRRIAFAASRASFERMLHEVVPSEAPGAAVDRRLGAYKIDRYAADPRGGVYFRVHSGGDYPGPDSMSYGFVYQPNAHGAPFGAAKYRVFRLGGDWYWFRVSDDW